MNHTIQSLISEIHILHKEYQSFDKKGHFRGLKQRASTRLTYTSNALEWNTLTEQETSLIINDGLSVAGKQLIEIQEAINHAKAVDYILSRPHEKTIDKLGQQELCQIHKHILQNIQAEQAGTYRTVPVRIQGSQTILPNYMKVPQLMYDREKNLQSSAEGPVMLALQAHYDIVTIHPFIDGNGRTARLFMNGILTIAGYPLVSIDPSTRSQYLSSLESYQTKWLSDQYFIYMLSILRDTLQEYLQMK